MVEPPVVLKIRRDQQSAQDGNEMIDRGKGVCGGETPIIDNLVPVGIIIGQKLNVIRWTILYR